MPKQLEFRDTDPQGHPLGRQATKTDLVDIARALGCTVVDDKSTVYELRHRIRARLQQLSSLLPGIQTFRQRG